MKRPPRNQPAAPGAPGALTLAPLAAVGRPLQRGPGAASPRPAEGGRARGVFEWDAERQAYVIATEEAAYRILLGPEGERSGLLHVEGRLGDGPWLPLIRNGGMLLLEADGAILPPEAAHQRVALDRLEPAPRGRLLVLEYLERLGDRSLQRRLQFRAAGRSLEIEVSAPGRAAAEAPGPAWCGVSLGRIAPGEAEGTARRVAVPGLPEPLFVLEPDGFLGACADRFRGAASAYPPGAALYRPDTEGALRPIRETLYVTLSSDPLDPLPALRRPGAPYRVALEGRVVVDLFSDAPYREDARLIEKLPLYGLEDVLLVYRNWQQFGYNRRMPAHYPADSSRGSNDEFRAMLERATSAGWLVALREEYAVLSPDSPYWSEKAVALGPDGRPRRSRPAPGRAEGDVAIAADRMLDFARLEATQIQRNYPVAAVFVDEHTAWDPEEGLRQVDAAPNSGAGTEAQAIRHLEGLFAFLREVHEGPVVGAGGEGPARFDTFAAGLAEGVLRGPEGGRDGALLVDYELQVVRPKLVGIGAGSYRLFFHIPEGERADPARLDWDAYRATEIALGHVGYLGNEGLGGPGGSSAFPGGSAANAAREYYLLRPLQELYVAGEVRSIRYRSGEALLSLAEALRSGLDLSEAQLAIEYANGLRLWVNRARQERWIVEDPEGERFELPPGGFLAVAPKPRLRVYSALVAGRRADVCECPQHTFIDGRGAGMRNIEGVMVEGAVVLRKSVVAGRQDVLLIGARRLQLGEEQYHLSERADVRLTHRSARELEVLVLDTESGKPIHVAWPAFGGPGSPWPKAGRLAVSEWEEGAWRPSRAQVQFTRTGPQLSRARPGVPYRIVAEGSG